MRNRLKTLKTALAVCLLLQVLALVAFLDISRWPIHPRFALPAHLRSPGVQRPTPSHITQTPTPTPSISTPTPHAQSSVREPGGRQVYAQPQPIEPDIAALAEIHLNDWISAWKAVAPEFEFRQFKKGTEGRIWEEPHVFVKDELDAQRQPLYAFSPDRTRFVDPYGGMALGEENGRLVAAFDHGSGVTLYDLKTLRAQRLAYCGSACTFEDAIWISNDLIAVVGRSHHCGTTHCRWVPMLILFDLSRNTESIYLNLEELNPVKDSDYFRARLKQKLPEINF